MPIPWGLVLSIGKVTYDLTKSDKIQAEADRKNEKSILRIINAGGEMKAAEEKMNAAVKKLMNRKNGILSGTMKKFLDLYENKITIIFKENKSIINSDFFSTTQLDNLSFQISNVYLPVNAPVITPNVVSGLLLGGIFGAVSGSMVDDANKNLAIAKVQSRNASAIETQSKTIKLSYDVVIERVNRMNDLLNRLNFLLLKSMEEVLSIFSQDKDVDRYTENELATVGLCCNIAKSIKVIIDAPIIDQNGEITKECKAALELGNNCLEKVYSLTGNR